MKVYTLLLILCIIFLLVLWASSAFQQGQWNFAYDYAKTCIVKLREDKWQQIDFTGAYQCFIK